MKNFLKTITNNGSLIISYTLIQGLSLPIGFILNHLIMESNYAENNNFFYEDRFFIFEFCEIAASIGISYDCVSNSIKGLKNLGLVKTKRCSEDKYNLISVEENEIIQYVKDIENKSICRRTIHIYNKFNAEEL